MISRSTLVEEVGETLLSQETPTEAMEWLRASFFASACKLQIHFALGFYIFILLVCLQSIVLFRGRVNGVFWQLHPSPKPTGAWTWF